MIEVRAPGKLMLSGEWSVLEVGVPCIVLAINQKVGVKIKEAKNIRVNTPDLGIENIEAVFDGKNLTWKKELNEKEIEKLSVTKRAVEITLQYLESKNKKIKPFEITTFSSDTLVELPNGEKTKVGFGSSAAICVAIVAAILKMHEVNIKEKKGKELIYNIACTAHYLAQGKVGSSFDIAASTYGGVLVYKRFDPKGLIEQINSGKAISEIMDSQWPAFAAENIELPKKMILLVGFVGYSASTKELILKLNSFKESQKEHYWKIINSIKGITEQLIQAIKQKNEKGIIELLGQNRKQLQELSNSSQNNLETKELAGLADLAESFGAAGKFSGAGGGDCGIAVCFDKKTAEKIKNAWKEKGIVFVDVKISKEGVE